jgi:transcriptional regulator with XRE-family HTH domain
LFLLTCTQQQILPNYFVLPNYSAKIPFYMKFFQSNTEKLRKGLGVTQAEMSDRLGLSRSTWQGYEKGTSTPNLSGLYKIAEYFGIGAVDLLETDLNNVQDKVQKTAGKTGKKLSQIVQDNVQDNVQDKQKNIASKPESPALFIGYSERGNVYEFDTKAAAGVGQILQDQDKLNRLPTLHLPHLGHGLHMRIKITGDSMHATIKDGDMVVATHVAEPATELREGNVHVIFDKDDGVVCKRVFKADRGYLMLESDNEIYKPYKRHLNDMVALFKVVELHTSDLKNYYSDCTAEISKLWNEINLIRKKLPA